MGIIDELSEHFGIGVTDLTLIIESAPARYKEFDILKRDGTLRRIAQPSRELKALQRYILENKLIYFPIHKSATGYVKDANIYENATAHAKNDKILKLDFSNFFPSIKVSDWELVARKKRLPGISRFDLSLYSKILFWGKKTRVPTCLSIGAPTSPMISNIVMYDLDFKFFQSAKKYDLIYTRYADDLVFSGKSYELLDKIEKEIRLVIDNTSSPSLQINEKKRGMYGRGQRRYITGLVLTPDQAVSLGRDRKRLISSMIHRYKLRQLDRANTMRLKGFIGFSIANEVEFIERMRLKYGNDVIDTVLNFKDDGLLK